MNGKNLRIVGFVSSIIGFIITAFGVYKYEEAKGMHESKELINKAKGKKSIGIIIGPEGGFEKEEIEQLKAVGGKTMSLGKRILRTETAGMTVLSILMFTIEE